MKHLIILSLLATCLVSQVFATQKTVMGSYLSAAEISSIVGIPVKDAQVSIGGFGVYYLSAKWNSYVVMLPNPQDPANVFWLHADPGNQFAMEMMKNMDFKEVSGVGDGKAYISRVNGAGGGSGNQVGACVHFVKNKKAYEITVTDINSEYQGGMDNLSASAVTLAKALVAKL